MKSIINCAHRELIATDSPKLIPNPKNPNKHPDDQIERLAKIIAYQGQRSPIVISNLSGFITKGHGRLMAIKKLGWESVAVDYQDYENAAQEYADIVADNAIAEWSDLDRLEISKQSLELGQDLTLDMLGLKDFEIIIPEILDPQTDEDEVLEVVNPISKRGDIWLLGNHRLMCGDSTMIDDVEKLMNGEKADMVFTDPPYGIGFDKENQKIGKSQTYGAVLNDHNNQVAIDSFNLITGLNIPLLYFWGANHYSNALPPSPGWIVWDKQDGKHVTYADVELCYSNHKSPARKFKHIWDGFRRDSERGEKRVHPTQKPIELIKEIWEFFKDDSKIVLDLFLGSGSTLIACEQTKRKCFGMELDEKYCDVIINRWQNYTGKKATLESTKQAYEELKSERA